MVNVKNRWLSGLLLSFLTLSCLFSSPRAEAGSPLQTKQFIQAGNKTLGGNVNLFNFSSRVGGTEQRFFWGGAPSFGLFLTKGLMLEGNLVIGGSHVFRTDKDEHTYNMSLSVGAGLKYFFDLSTSFLPFVGLNLYYRMANLLFYDPAVQGVNARVDFLFYRVSAGLLLPLTNYLALEFKVDAGLSHALTTDSNAQPLFSTAGSVGVFWFF